MARLILSNAGLFLTVRAMRHLSTAEPLFRQLCGAVIRLTLFQLATLVCWCALAHLKNRRIKGSSTPVIRDRSRLEGYVSGGLPAYVRAEIGEICLQHAVLTADGDEPLFLIGGSDAGRLTDIVKRVFDVAFATVAVLLGLPLFAVIALLIHMEDGQRVIYRQKRCTKDMREFDILKFRTMRIDDENHLTGIGAFLRKTKLDELPQLINVLRGDMSIVGPRPERPERIRQIEREIPEFAMRHTVRAGLTGYAQVHGRHDTEPKTKLKWDLLYLQNRSLLLDMKIILMTIPVVLKGNGDA